MTNRTGIDNRELYTRAKMIHVLWLFPSPGFAKLHLQTSAYMSFVQSPRLHMSLVFTGTGSTFCLTSYLCALIPHCKFSTLLSLRMCRHSQILDHTQLRTPLRMF